MHLFAYREKLIAYLAKNSTLNAVEDIRYILQHVLQLSRVQLQLALPTRIISEKEQKTIFHLVQRRLANEPLDYILEESHFLGCSYYVSPGVLIPRSETEYLALAVNHLIKTKLSPNITALECGFGSGIISISCAKENPKSQWLSFDCSQQAYMCAKHNAKKHGIRNVSWILGDFFKSQQLWQAKKPSLLVSNPPYIPTQELKTLDSSVRLYEPHSALDGGPSGLWFYERIIQTVQRYPMYLCLECGHTQSKCIQTLAIDAGMHVENIIHDIHGVERHLILKNRL